jgi:hypothetical protein
MQAEYIAAKLAMDDLKARHFDTKDGLFTTDKQGKVLFTGFAVKVGKPYNVQSDLSRAPVKTIRAEVKKETPNGRDSYHIISPMRDLCEKTPEWLLKAIGDDAQFLRDDPYDSIVLAILSKSFPETEHTSPTYNTMQFVEGGCWYYASDAEVGERSVALVANAEIEVVREIKNEETGESAFRLRCPRADGSGFDFCTVSYSDFQMGQGISFPGRAVSIHNSAKLGLCLGSRFSAATAADRLELERTEREQPQRDSQARVEDQFRRGAPLYSAPHYKTRGM